MFKWKEFGFGVSLAVLLAVVFLFWKNAVLSLVFVESRTYLSLIYPLLGLLATASLFSFNSIFMTNRWWAYLPPVFGISFPFFTLPASNSAIMTFAASIFLLVFATYRLRKEHELSLGFSVSKILKSGLPVFFTTAALVISVFYLNAVGGSQEQAISSIFPRSFSNFTIRLLSSQLQSVIGLPVALDPNKTVDETLKDFLEQQSVKEGLSLDKISPNEIQRFIEAERRDIADQFGIQLSGDEKISDAFYQTATARLIKLVGPYQTYLPFASAMAFFLAFKTFTIPLFYLTVILEFLLIKTAKFANILKSEKRNIEVEKLTL